MSAQVVWWFGVALLYSWWVRHECITTDKRPFFEIETYVFMGWPLYLPYYLLASRRLAGVPFIFLFLGLCFLPFVAWGMANAFAAFVSG